MEKFDVTVIGAGIAGSVLARLLAQAGKSVLLVEKDAFSGKTNACGGLFDKSYYDHHFSNEGLIEQRISKNTFIMPWGEVTFDCDQVTVKRRYFDRSLAEMAQAQGAVLRNHSRALEFNVQAPGLVVVRIQDLESKREYEVESKIVAFTDGPKSLAAINPLFNAKKNKRFWAYAYAYEVEGIPFDADTIKIYLNKDLFPWGYGWIFPNKTESNIGVGSIYANKLNAAGIKKKLIYFMNGFRQTASLLAQRDIVDKKGGYIPMWLIDNFADDSQVVLGDAAGMVSPLFGAGIDYAIEAAEACAVVLTDALKQKSYSRIELQKYEQKIKSGFIADLKKQMLIARIIIFSLKFGKHWPIKILAVIAFGAKYSRWNKIKILFYPLLGKPAAVKNVQQNLSHK